MRSEDEAEKIFKALTHIVDTKDAAIFKSKRGDVKFAFTNEKGKTGLKHIILRRFEELGKDQNETEESTKRRITALLYACVDTINTSDNWSEQKDRRSWLVKKGGITVAVRESNGKLVVTGFEDNENKNEATETIRAVNAKYGYTHGFLEMYDRVGAVISSSLSIPQENNLSTKGALTVAEDILSDKDTSNAPEQENITPNVQKSTLFQDINQNINNSQEENNMSDSKTTSRPMTSVMNVEGFFNKEFTASELAGAIEELDFYSDEIKQKYNLENDPNAERTFVFGTLAANTIIEKYEDGIGIKISDNALDEIYKIGIEVAQGKYESYAELEPKLDTFLQNPKNSRPYSNDMRNLEKVLDTWEQQRIETANGTGIDTGGYHPDSVWIDNWRIRTISDDDQEWYLTYKGQEVVRCKYNEAVCVDEKPLLEGEKIIGDVLQVIQNKTEAHCPEFDDGTYKPSHDYFIDKMNYKEREFYKNPPYPGFAEQMERIKQMAKNTLENNGMLGDYKLVQVLPKSRHPEDKELSCVMAKSEKTGKYAVWTSFNTDASVNFGSGGSLDHGHYEIKNLNDAAKIMCDFSNSKPLHIEHHQQYKQNNDIER